MTYSISFIVPAFNEERNIEPTVRTIAETLYGKNIDYEIILVDDASQDATWSIMDALSHDDPRILSLHNNENLNLGGAYRRGVDLASKEFVIMVPGDNGYTAGSLDQILCSVGAADIVIPYPINAEARTPFREFASFAFTALINTLFGLNIRYYNGPVVHRTGLLKPMSIFTNSFAYQAEILVKMLLQGYSFVECPVQIQARQGGRSSAMKLKNQAGVVTTLIHLLFAVGPRGLRLRLSDGLFFGRALADLRRYITSTRGPVKPQ